LDAATRQWLDHVQFVCYLTPLGNGTNAGWRVSEVWRLDPERSVEQYLAPESFDSYLRALSVPGVARGAVFYYSDGRCPGNNARISVNFTAAIPEDIKTYVQKHGRVEPEQGV